MTVDQTLGVATWFEIASYIFLGLLVVAELIAISELNERKKHRAEVAGIIFLALLLGGDVGHSAFQHNADGILRTAAETERLRAEKSMATIATVTQEHQHRIEDASNKLKAAQQEIERDKAQIAALLGRVAKTERRTDVIQSLQVDLHVNVTTKERTVGQEDTYIDAASYVQLIDGSERPHPFLVRSMQSRQLSPTEFELLVSLVPVSDHGLLGEPIAALAKLKRMLCDFGGLLGMVRNDMPDDGTVVVKTSVVVNGVALSLRDSSAPSRYVLGAGGINLAEAAELPGRYRQAVDGLASKK